MDATLKNLFDWSKGRNIPEKFSAEEYDFKAALRDRIAEIWGNYYERKAHGAELYALLAENAEEVLPKRVEDMIGRFAEVKQYGNKDRIMFKRKTGKQRGKKFVTSATAAGVYETFRLDNESFDLKPHVVGGAGIIDFERYLDGDEDIMDIYDVLIDGYLDRVFEEVQNCLTASWNAAGRTAATKVTANNFDRDKMASLVNLVSAYGTPVIYCGAQFASTMTNYVTTANGDVKMSERDVEDYRNQGYIGKFAGADVVVIPNSFTDETNEKMVFNPRFAYVIPAGHEKIVQVALVGPTIIDEFQNPDRSVEVQGYKKLAVAITTNPNYWAIYYNSSIEDGGFNNAEIVGP